MNATQSLKQLLLTIQTDRKYYIALEKLLLKQRQYVIRYQSAKLLAVNEHLTELYQALSQTTMERIALLKELKVAPNKEGLQTLFNRLPEQYREHVTALWADLEQRVKNCQQHNQRNGQLLSMQKDILTSSFNYQEEFIYAG